MNQKLQSVWLLDDDLDYLSFLSMGLSDYFTTKICSNISQLLRLLRDESQERPTCCSRTKGCRKTANS